MGPRRARRARRARRVRGSLASRIALLAAAVAVITAVVAGLLSVGLTQSVSESQARRTLSRIADAASASADFGATGAGQARARRTLQAVQVEFAIVGPTGVVTSNDRLARDAVTTADIAVIRAHGSRSERRTVDGHTVFVEVRSTKNGGLVVVQRRTDALAVVNQAIRRVLLALAIGVAIAVLLGLLVAYRIARPLRRTAAAAHAMAWGARDIAIDPQGPAEVAEVGIAVNTLAAALSHSETRQREFLLSVSHDLRTPLTAISGYAESFADGVVPPERTAEFGAVMLAEAHRLNRLVSDLLDLARLDAQEFRIDLAPADVVLLARDAERVWSARCAGDGVAFRLEVPAAALVVVTDAGRLRQVLDGLLENALRVTPSGRPIVVAVRTEASVPTGTGAGFAGDPGPGADGGVIVIEVRDGGPGLTDADLPVAFERSVLHERYRAVRQVGTGFGLAIVRGLVGRLGASIEAGHAFEGGARFTVRLPVQPADRP